MAEPVIIVDYDPGWVETFMKLRDRIAEWLGDLPIAIDHIGSTSIPGAAAKPVIDVDVVLRSAADVPKAIRALEKTGYRHLGELGVPGREAFESPSVLPAHHLYVVVIGGREHGRHLRFRDYLRDHPEEVERYSALKKALASKFRDDREAYTEAKTAFVEEVLLLAGGTGVPPSRVARNQ
jgi:GrpB-like predicted nucleotidyltransferase (UPF0157 family)